MRKKSNSWILGLAVVALVVFASGAASAQYIGAAFTSGGPSTLYAIDSAGAATPIGPIGFLQVGGIDVDPHTGTVYGIGRRPGDGTRVLIRIDARTGAGTEIGPVGLISYDAA